MIDPVLMAELDEIDTAMIVMRTASGKQCHINNSRTAVYGYDQRIELMGSAGMVQSGNRKPHEMKRYSAKSGEVAEPYLKYFFIERYTEAFMAEIDAFVDAVEFGKGARAELRRRTPCPHPGRGGLQSRSARIGGLVQVSEIA